MKNFYDMTEDEWMRAAKRRRIILFSAIGAVFVGIIVVVLILVFGGKGKEKAVEMEFPDDMIAIDMTSPDSTKSKEYGRIYYYPIEEEHIATSDDNIKYVDNEILVVANEGVTREEVSSLAASYRAEIVGEIEVTGDYQLKLNGVKTADELQSLIDDIGNESIIDQAMLNYVSEISEAKQTEERNGFYYGKKWQKDLQNFNNAKGKSWGLEAINTFGAWDKLCYASRTVKPVRVGIIDCGFDVNHEDLRFAEVFYENGANGVYMSNRDHGTHVTGTIAADNSNNTGICGVYPYGSGRIYGVAYPGVEYYSENGTHYESALWMKCSFAELIVRDVKVINTSFNNRRDRVGQIVNKEQGWQDALNELNKNADVIGDFLNRLLIKGYDFCICSAAGNSSTAKTGNLDATYNSFLNAVDKNKYPEVYDRIIVVGAVDNKYKIASYSNGGNRVDIYAPGTDIYSTMPNNKYKKESGTSMATPHVSGVAAMVWSANNSLTGAQVKEAICYRGNMRCTSCKMLDAFAAVEYALGKENNKSENNVENGGVLCYVVEKNNESVKISNAEVLMVNTVSDERYTTKTDDSGHFELMVPEGKYTLSVKASGYLDYNWPDGNTNYKNPIVVKNKGINYLDDWIKMTKAPNASTGEAQPPTNATTTGGTADKSKEYDINTNEDDFLSFLEDDSLDYGIPLEDVVAWTTYNGHLYALFDYSISAHAMSLITAIDPTVHLVTIADADEQEVMEELISRGGRTLYYTGGVVDKKGKLMWITGESAKYSNWYEDGPVDYNEEGYEDIAVIYRGYEYYADDDPDFGKWLEILENEYSFLDIFDTDVEGISCGIVIEWDDPQKYGVS